MTIPPNQTTPEGGVEKRQAELIREAASGDQQALAALYDATSRTVYGLLLRILSDASAAEVPTAGQRMAVATWAAWERTVSPALQALAASPQMAVWPDFSV